MFKTVKGKVVTGVVTVGLLSGVGAAFASTDVGTMLQNWYNGQFNQSAAKIQSDATNYVGSKAPGLAREYNTLKSDAKSDINATKTTSINDSTADINNAKQGHVDALNAKEAEIASNIESQFNQIYSIANQAINTAGTQAYNYASTDLTKLTTKEGTKALEEVNTQLTAVKDQANADLQAEIDAAKADLQSQLNAEASATTEEIKVAIDAKIAEVRTLIQTKVAELVAEQQTLIANAASQLEDQAKSELDDVVANGF